MPTGSKSPPAPGAQLPMLEANPHAVQLRYEVRLVQQWPRCEKVFCLLLFGLKISGFTEGRMRRSPWYLGHKSLSWRRAVAPVLCPGQEREAVLVAVFFICPTATSLQGLALHQTERASADGIPGIVWAAARSQTLWGTWAR